MLSPRQEIDQRTKASWPESAGPMRGDRWMLHWISEAKLYESELMESGQVDVAEIVRSQWRMIESVLRKRD